MRTPTLYLLGGLAVTLLLNVPAGLVMMGAAASRLALSDDDEE